jgi:hypothetical protein
MLAVLEVNSFRRKESDYIVKALAGIFRKESK